MKSSPREIETHLAMLKRTPGFIAEVSAELTDAQLRTPPEPGAWSMVELLAHLHACADVWGDDIDRMLKHDTPKFTKPHPRRIMKASRFLDPPFADSLAAFTALRDRLLATLTALGPAQWERSAAINGRSHTVFTQMRRMALHEAAHQQQFHAIRAAVLAEI